MQVVYSDGSSWDVTNQATWTISGAGTNTVDSAGLVTYGTGHNVVKVSYAGFNRYIDVYGQTAAGTGTLQRIEVRPNSVTGPNGDDGNGNGTYSFQAFAYTDSPDWSSNPVTDITSAATWTTSNPAIATVAADGTATALGTGKVKITATYNGKTSSATWIISSGLWIHIHSNDGGGTMNMIAINYTGTAGSDETENVTWTSSNPVFAWVTNGPGGGTVTLTGSGTATITAKLGGTSSANSVEITA